MLRRALGLAAWVGPFALAWTCHPREPAPAVLREGFEEASAIAVGPVRRYAADLPAEAFLEVQVEQQGVDLTLAARCLGRTDLVSDTPNGRRGPERLLLWMAEASSCSIELEATEADEDARFEIRVAALRPGSELDRLAAEAFAVGTQADEHRRSGSPERLDLAAATYRREQELWRELGAVEGQVHALDGLARVLDRQHRRQQRCEVMEALAEIYERQGNRSAEARALADLGELRVELGQHAEGQAALEAGLALLAGELEPETEARIWNALGNLHQAQGRYGSATSAYQRSVPLWNALGRPRDEATARANVAFLLAELGEAERSLDEIARARELLPRGSRPQDEAYILERELDSRMRLGRLEGGAALAERAVVLREEVGDPRTTAHALSTQAMLAYRSDDFDSAEALLIRARELMLEAGDAATAASLTANLGWSQFRAGKTAAAKDSFTEALPELERALNHRTLAAALAGLAWVARQDGDLTQAREHSLAALERLEGLRSSTDRLDFRASLFADRQQYFDLAVGVLMQLHAEQPAAGFDAEGFAVSERGHSRVLLETLPSLPERTPAGPLFDELSRREQRVRQAQDSCEETGLPGRPAVRKLDCERELRDALAALRELETVAAPSGELGPVSLAEVQRELLGGGQQLLLYDLGRERSYLWVVSSRNVHTFVLPGSAVLEPLALATHRALAASHQRWASVEAERHSAALARQVLAEALPALEAGPLLIAREGALLYVPFGALLVPGAEGALEPLAQRHVISYVPSASAAVWLERLQPVRPPPEVEVLAFGDPIVEPRDRVGIALDPELLAGPPLSRLGRLPFSGEEARAVVSAAPEHQGVAFLGDDARKDRLTKDRLPSTRFLHFATHGLADDRHPELSGLVLSRYDQEGRAQDGFLQAHEIARLRLDAEVVVLSACDSGLGARIAGEGLVGLPHAFLRAGASRVLASLWRVNDPAAPVLMGELYRGMLGRGLAPAAALREAQLRLAKEPRWSRPYYWAGFVLIGGN